MTLGRGYLAPLLGMPDAFEVLYGTSSIEADNNGDLDGDGYTNLENYLHWAARPR
jgi:hypothetical protein